MSKWRKKTDGTAETEKDLTDRQDFDWVGYLKAHPDLTVIVPDGKVVVRFAIARLAIMQLESFSMTPGAHLELSALVARHFQD